MKPKLSPLERFKDAVILEIVTARERKVSVQELHATLDLLNERLICRLPALEEMAAALKRRKRK